MRALAILAVIFILLPLALLAIGQFGLLTGKRPNDLGARDGRLKPPSATPNSVSSQAGFWPDAPQRETAGIAPLAMRGPADAAMTRLADAVARQPGCTIVDGGGGYLRAECETRWLRFVDDLEFLADPAAGVIHVRSASRLGRKDFGTNRARVEAIRRRYEGA